jgi:hypothetical protein
MSWFIYRSRDKSEENEDDRADYGDEFDEGTVNMLYFCQILYMHS